MRLTVRAAFVLCFLCTAHLLTAQTAGIAGKWLFVLSTGEYSAEYTAEMQLAGEQVTGTLAGQKLDGAFRDGELALKFPFHPPEAEAPDVLAIDAQLDGDALSGSFTFSEYAGTFQGTRRP
jgi:hypothetical protein